jgi:hypothetical protein
MAGMASCVRCGGELPPAARFCPTCGRPADPGVGPPAPPATAPIWSGLRLPGWAGADWALVGLGVARSLLLLFGASALFGLVAAVAVAGNVAAAPCGAAVGSHLAFAAFGARVAAGCGGDHGAALALGFLPLPWALTGGLATEAALRFGWRRLPDDRVRRMAYAGKLALAGGVTLGIIAGLVSRGDPNPQGSTFGSSVNGGEVWFYTTVLTSFWAWIGLRRRGVRLLPAAADGAGRFGGFRGTGGHGAAGGLGGAGGLGRFRRPAAEGAATFAALACALAAVGLCFALVVADDGASRIGVVFGFPVVGLSFGAALVDGAMGVALGGVSGHTSLFHFGLPAGPGSGAAPAWLFAALALAPAAVGATVWRRLDRQRPADEQGALSAGALTGVGFAAAAWLTALVGRIVLLASVADRAGGWFGYAPGNGARFDPGAPVAHLVVARPDPAAVLGLALLWGLAGGLGAAFLWASRHNARWQISGSGEVPGASAAAGPAPAATSPPASGPAPPAASPPAAGPAPPATSPPAAGPTAWLLPETDAPATGAGPFAAARGPEPDWSAVTQPGWSAATESGWPPAPAPSGPAGDEPTGPPGDGPSGTAEFGPASGGRSGAAAPSGSGTGSAAPDGARSPGSDGGQGAGGPEEPSEEPSEEPPEKP